MHIYIGLHNDAQQTPGQSCLLLLFAVRNVPCANPSALRIRSCTNCGRVVGHRLHDELSLQDPPCAPPTLLGAGTGDLTTHACQHALLRAIVSDDLSHSRLSMVNPDLTRLVRVTGQVALYPRRSPVASVIRRRSPDRGALRKVRASQPGLSSHAGPALGSDGS
jgi:hypothetical protein